MKKLIILPVILVAVFLVARVVSALDGSGWDGTGEKATYTGNKTFTGSVTVSNGSPAISDTAYTVNSAHSFAGSNDPTTGNQFTFGPAGNHGPNNTTGTVAYVAITPRITSSSTGANTDLLINRTVASGPGSGSQNYIVGQTAGISYFTVSAVGNIETAGMIRAIVPSSQTIAAGNTIAADACGSIKQITASGGVTTDTTNTFTAPAAGNSGCCMDVINVGAQTITLDENANFVSAGDVALGAGDTARVCSNGTTWYQISGSNN